jgi:hypothetical protein
LLVILDPCLIHILTPAVMIVIVQSNYRPTVLNHLCSWYQFSVHLFLHNTAIVHSLHDFPVWHSNALNWTLADSLTLVGLSPVGKILACSQETSVILVSQAVSQTFLMLVHVGQATQSPHTQLL